MLFSPVDVKVVFTANGKNLLADGWWGRLRHPNYFGDILVAISWGIPAGLFHFVYHVKSDCCSLLRDPSLRSSSFIPIPLSSTRSFNETCAIACDRAGIRPTSHALELSGTQIYLNFNASERCGLLEYFTVKLLHCATKCPLSLK